MLAVADVLRRPVAPFVGVESSMGSCTARSSPRVVANYTEKPVSMPPSQFPQALAHSLKGTLAIPDTLPWLVPCRPLMYTC